MVDGGLQMADAEIGKCVVCGTIGVVARTYFSYDIKCECHAPNHFEIVKHCVGCVPKEPTETRIVFKTKDLPRSGK